MNSSYQRNTKSKIAQQGRSNPVSRDLESRVAATERANDRILKELADVKRSLNLSNDDVPSLGKQICNIKFISLRWGFCARFSSQTIDCDFSRKRRGDGKFDPTDIQATFVPTEQTESSKGEQSKVCNRNIE